MTPVLLIPGLLSTADLFAPQVEALWPHGPVMVASTLTGDTLADMAAAILADAPPRFALAGISMGGYLSLEILRQAPERVVRLALLDTSARPDTPEQSARRRTQLDQARAGDLRATLRPALSALLHPAHRDDDALVERLLRMATSIGVEGLARQTRALIGRIDSRPHLAAIAVPTVVLVGDGDEVTPLPLAQELVGGIPGAELAVIPRAGHATTLEQPELVNRALVRWIQG